MLVTAPSSTSSLVPFLVPCPALFRSHLHSPHHRLIFYPPFTSGGCKGTIPGPCLFWDQVLLWAASFIPMVLCPVYGGCTQVLWGHSLEPQVGTSHFPLGASTWNSHKHVKSKYPFVVQLLSRIQLFSTLWTESHQASLSFTISEFAHTHAHWVGDAIQPSRYLHWNSFFCLFRHIPSVLPLPPLFSVSAVSSMCDHP